MNKKEYIYFLIFIMILLNFNCSTSDNKIPKKYKQFEYLLEPAISNKNDQNMLVVEFKGDPNVVGKKAFSLLFRTFYRLQRENKNVKLNPPRARWPLGLQIKKDEWIGLYGIKIPDFITKLPEDIKDKNIKIQKWEYGDVAEILHIGSYDAEEETIEKLNEFIDNKGYEIKGKHEEEYLKGPGIIFKGNPDKYLTILRYNVIKK